MKNVDQDVKSDAVADDSCPVADVFADVFRMPRSFAESPNYCCDWRSLQVNYFMGELRRMDLPGDGSFPALSETGNDKYVRDFYDFSMRRPPAEGDDSKLLRWVEDCNDGDHTIGVSMRAMILAGRDDESIAAEFGITPRHVEYFSALFFDVRPYLKERVVLAQIVRSLRPITPRAYPGDIERLERLVFPVALYGSPELLDALLRGSIPLTGKLAKEYNGIKSVALDLAGPLGKR